MTRYRVYTENKNFDETIAEAGKCFPCGMTVYTGIGVYANTVEECIVIEVICDINNTPVYIDTFINWLKGRNGQECVLITEEHIKARFV
jgi:hypothetical protein